MTRMTADFRFPSAFIRVIRGSIPAPAYTGACTTSVRVALVRVPC